MLLPGRHIDARLRERRTQEETHAKVNDAEVARYVRVCWEEEDEEERKYFFIHVLCMDMSSSPTLPLIPS